MSQHFSKNVELIDFKKEKARILALRKKQAIKESTNVIKFPKQRNDQRNDND